MWHLTARDGHIGLNIYHHIPGTYCDNDITPKWHSPNVKPHLVTKISNLVNIKQVCPGAHTHAELYRTRATVVHLFKAQTDLVTLRS